MCIYARDASLMQPAVLMQKGHLYQTVEFFENISFTPVPRKSWYDSFQAPYQNKSVEKNWKEYHSGDITHDARHDHAL